MLSIIGHGIGDFLFGIISLLLKPTKSKFIGIFIAFLIAYVGFKYISNPILHLLAEMAPIIVLIYIGSTKSESDKKDNLKPTEASVCSNNDVPMILDSSNVKDYGNYQMPTKLVRVTRYTETIKETIFYRNDGDDYND